MTPYATQWARERSPVRGPEAVLRGVPSCPSPEPSRSLIAPGRRRFPSSNAPGAALELNSLRAGQSQPVRSLPDADAVCYVLEGRGSFTVGEGCRKSPAAFDTLAHVPHRLRRLGAVPPPPMPPWRESPVDFVPPREPAISRAIVARVGQSRRLRRPGEPPAPPLRDRARTGAIRHTAAVLRPTPPRHHHFAHRTSAIRLL